MKNDLIFIVQECICIDFLINAIMTSNMYKHFKFFSEVKKENLKNIKVICHLYRYIYNDDLLIKDTPGVKLDENPENNLITLLEYSLNVLTRIDILKKQHSNSYYNKLLKGLYNNYFDLISYIHCFTPLSYNNYFYLKNEKSNTSNFNSNNNSPLFFNILNSSSLEFYHSKNKIELIRAICIEAISIFFDSNLIENLIIDEYYEIFFENNPENKFYQFFFKSNDRSFKVRIYDKSLIVFYLYQINNIIENIPKPLNKEYSKLAVDEFLEKKFKEEFKNLFYDENYINSSYYNNDIESYKFKYNYNNRNINIERCIYISINVNSSIIQEIYLI